MIEKADVIIIGAGPGGLSAGVAAREAGAGRVIVLEREKEPGGILNQCLHDGFGIVRYGAQLSGPEYAEIEYKQAIEAGVEIITDQMVVELRSGGEYADRSGAVITSLGEGGMRVFEGGAVVLATGCRERTRGALSIPGSRPAGIFTAGVAQNLINLKNVMIGRRVMILGSGDIGLIMARRLTLEGAQVLGVLEIMDQPCGLARNVQQCLFDFNIPLYLGHTVSDIRGRDRLESLEISRVDSELKPISGTEQIIECDTLVLSVGLIPENEIAEKAGVELDGRTNGTVTDQYLQTSLPGIFSCGNSRAVMDLADFVSEQGQAAGANAARYVLGREMIPWQKNPHNVARKGLPPEGSVTCTSCPKGCQVYINTDMDSADYGKISGNGCSRGEGFARQEAERPMRILTTTVRSSDGGLIPVRSDRPVYLDEMKELAGVISRLEPQDKADLVGKSAIISGLGQNHVDIISEKEYCINK